MNSKILKQNGYSMVEIIIYLALAVIVSVFVIDNLITLFRNYSLVKQNQEVEYNAINILDKITRDTRDSKNVIVGQSLFEIPQGYVTLNNASGTISFYLENNRIKYMKDGKLIDNLSNKNVSVNNFKIFYINSTTTEAIKIELGINTELVYKNFYTTIQLRD